MIERSRLVSFYQPLPENGTESPQETLDRAIIVLRSLREQFRNHGYVDRISANDDLALKQCFNEAVVNYTRSEDAQLQLEEVFQDWHPALTSKSIKVLIFLISRVPSALNSLFDHIDESLRNH